MVLVPIVSHRLFVHSRPVAVRDNGRAVEPSHGAWIDSRGADEFVIVEVGAGRASGVARVANQVAASYQLTNPGGHASLAKMQIARVTTIRMGDLNVVASFSIALLSFCGCACDAALVHAHYFSGASCIDLSSVRHRKVYPWATMPTVVPPRACDAVVALEWDPVCSLGGVRRCGRKSQPCEDDYPNHNGPHGRYDESAHGSTPVNW